MIRKLLKYDLNYMIKDMLPFYILTIFFAITTKIFFSLNQTVVIIGVIGQISVGCFFSVMASILINTLMRSWVSFSDSLYKDRSYLTHTLPVTKKELYESKFIQAVVFLLISFITVIIGLFIVYYSKENIILFKNYINGISSSIDVSTGVFIILVILLLFVELLNGIQSGYLGIILGNKKNNNKITYSLIFGFIIYIVSQIFMIGLLFIISLFNSNIHSIFTSNAILNNDIIKLVGVIGIILYLIVILITNIISVKCLNKGVDIE